MSAIATDDLSVPGIQSREEVRFSLTDDEIALSFSIYFTWGYPDYMRVALQHVVDTWTGSEPLDAQKELSWKQLRNVIEIADSTEMRMMIASNVTTPQCVLNFLAQTPDEHIVQRVAENAGTHVATLTRLVRHASVRVRLSLSEHGSLPEPLYFILAADLNDDVRHTLAENFNVPTAVLELLSADENPYVAARAAKTLARAAATAAVPAQVLKADFGKGPRRKSARASSV